ncbi:hypothetical protein G7Y89_g1549 [Cudoniella acicularis]|uniref:Uncharacterized protein n=1 Tax=Cudoniella acicularis TaxID=354080 RepID=A0A8H4WA66_9HELO|nr:hypothetical protein G7Y89_g1549 [Cudoniella acicularis]
MTPITNWDAALEKWVPNPAKEILLPQREQDCLNQWRAIRARSWTEVGVQTMNFVYAVVETAPGKDNGLLNSLSFSGDALEWEYTWYSKRFVPGHYLEDECTSSNYTKTLNVTSHGYSKDAILKHRYLADISIRGSENLVSSNFTIDRETRHKLRTACFVFGITFFQSPKIICLPLVDRDIFKCYLPVELQLSALDQLEIHEADKLVRHVYPHLTDLWLKSLPRRILKCEGQGMGMGRRDIYRLRSLDMCPALRLPGFYGNRGTPPENYTPPTAPMADEPPQLDPPSLLFAKCKLFEKFSTVVQLKHDLEASMNEKSPKTHASSSESEKFDYLDHLRMGHFRDAFESEITKRGLFPLERVVLERNTMYRTYRRQHCQVCFSEARNKLPFLVRMESSMDAELREVTQQQ